MSTTNDIAPAEGAAREEMSGERLLQEFEFAVSHAEHCQRWPGANCPKCAAVYSLRALLLARLAAGTRGAERPMGTNQEYVLMAAVRYQLPRMTYGSGIVADSVCAAWPRLSENARSVILRDVNEALDRNEAGMECDRSAWLRIVHLTAAPAPRASAGEVG